ncbi:MAG TPA: TetR/AcrR family transcriptional regulator [Sphingobium sp.]
MPATPRVRDDPEVRRALILEQAIGLIGERGYHGFTVQELARRSGLSNPGLLYYFPSKSAILLAVLQELETRAARDMAPLVTAVQDGLGEGGGRAAVLALLRAMIVRSVSQPELCRLLAALQIESLDPSHPAHGWWQRREAVVLSLFGGLLSPFVADAPSVARQLLALIDGLCLQWLRAGQAIDFVVEWDRALARLVPELWE